MSEEALDSLKKKRLEIDRAIKTIEKSEKAKKKAHVLATNYARVVCLTCSGSGTVTHGGADIISDPPDEDICGDCRGNGYRYRHLWDGFKDYNLEFDEGDGM